MSKKHTGAYYTPIKLSNFIITYLEKDIKNNYSILEPSVGDGSFIKALDNRLDNTKRINIAMVDLNEKELKKAKEKVNTIKNFNSILARNEDFLKFYQSHDLKYNIVIGNPPYIKGNLLKLEQLNLCKSIHKNAKLSDKKINNIWTSFIIGAEKFLNEDGILAYVLPTDLLQVKYAEEIRLFLEDKFERLEIFTLDKYMFDDIEQHTMLLFAYKKSNEKGTIFYKITDIENGKYEKISSNGLMIYESKWTHYILDSSEIKLLNKISKKLPKVNDFIFSKPGIVTGANAYFILNKSTVKQFKLEKYVEPIIQKSLLIKHNIELTTKNIKNLIDENKPMFLLHLTDDVEITEDLELYLAQGIKEQINNRYKCGKRNNWYCIPNISTAAEGFIFKRYHKVPKFMKNSAKVYVTDGAYNIVMKEDYKLDSFIYSFFNIVTLIFAELTGRKYGGGVMELIPSELKNLPIYYKEITPQRFNDFQKNFNKTIVLNIDIYNYLELMEEEVKILETIYQKLLHERLH